MDSRFTFRGVMTHVALSNVATKRPPFDYAQGYRIP